MLTSPPESRSGYALFQRRQQPAVLGVLHLPPLPGSPRPSPGLDAVEAHALRDARALVNGGVDGLVLENLGDAPFTGAAVAPATVAAMTRVALRIRDAHPQVPLGINVLRNDATAALAIAAAIDAAFIRVNVHVGVMVTDQGILQGEARHTLLERNRLGVHTRIAADVLVKHAAPLGPVDLAQLARDTAERGGADALIVTGSGTGQAIDEQRLRMVRGAAPEVPLWAGSGTSPQTWPMLRPWIDAAIVGTYFHEESRLDRPIDPQRVRALCDLRDRDRPAEG
jgi:membrane complex biogenesis BtpA family protein